MGKRWVRPTLFGMAVALIFAAGMPTASAIHWYRSTDGGCSAADGELTDDPEGTEQTVAETVILGHNTFSEGISGFDAASLVAPVETTISVGDSIRWTWNSAHCHSVTSDDFVDEEETVRAFDSGYHYPEEPPESPQAVPGFFEYPQLDDTPTLAYTRTFTEPGTYSYFCVHHASIGMRGVVIVEE